MVVAPVVDPAFRDVPNSPSSGGGGDKTGSVLVVGGSWGAGRLERAVVRLGRAGRKTKVICASNSRLYRRLRRRAGPAVEVLGWVDDVARLMQEADVVVENAGGLMAVEAMALDKPVVSFAPIPGHGRENVAAMAAAGIALLPDTAAELVGAIHDVADARKSPTRRSLQLHCRELFASPPADEVIWGLIDPAAKVNSNR